MSDTTKEAMEKAMEILGKREALKAVVEFCGEDLVYKNVRAGDSVIAYDASMDQLVFYEAENDFDSHMDFLVLRKPELENELEQILKEMPKLMNYNLNDKIQLRAFHGNMQVWSRKFAAYCRREGRDK